MKNCIKLRLLTISEDLNMKSNVSYCFIRCIAGEAIADREGSTRKDNWQDEAVWPWLWVLLMDIYEHLLSPAWAPDTY